MANTNRDLGSITKWRGQISTYGNFKCVPSFLEKNLMGIADGSESEPPDSVDVVVKVD